MKRPKNKLLHSSKIRKQFDAVVHITATFNNTIMTLTDLKGNALFWSSSGKQGFKGSKKATSFSAQTVGEAVGRRAQAYGIKDLKVKVRGPGPGRESAIRALYNAGMKVLALEDTTTIPHNGCKAPKRRRV
jgi:small subunit ribosomal protein S11